MAIRVQNNHGKILGQDSICSMPHFVNSPWLNMHEQQLSQTLSKNVSLRVESLSQCYNEVSNLDLQLEDQSSSSPRSSSQSRRGATAVEKSNSQDHCISSESVQNENYGKHVEEQVKPAFLVSNTEFSAHPSQVELCKSAFPSQAQVPYVYSDPYFSSLYSAYGPQAMIQPQMMGIAPVRVPLPPELAQDGPIYVNAKQYNGILRRRQMRAKLEAQNKLVKGRKPYLHESRHQHALNRVRGSGGRFLSTKKQQQSEPAASTDSFSASVYSHQDRNMLQMEAERSEDNRHNASTNSSSAAMGYTHGVAGIMHNLTPHRVPTTR